MLFRAWSYRRIQASSVEGLDGVGAGNGRELVSAGGLVVCQEDVATEGHSMGKLAMSHVPRVS